MRKIVGGTQGKDAESTLRRQFSCVSCGKYLVDRAITAASNDAINIALSGMGNGFGGQSCGVAGLPRNPHLHTVTIRAHSLNSCSQARISGCLAVQNNADSCHRLRLSCLRSPASTRYRSSSRLRIAARFSLPTWLGCSCLTIMHQANPRVSIELSHWTGRFDLASLLKPRHQHPATYGPGRSFGHGTYLNLRTPLGRSFRTLQATGHPTGSVLPASRENRYHSPRFGVHPGNSGSINTSNKQRLLSSN